MRFFNTAGPVNVLDHYCIDPLERLNKEEVLRLIEQKKYFVLHAPRQSGKTSCLLALARYLNQQGNYQCLYVNLEASFAVQDDLIVGMRNILYEIASRARDYLNNEFPESIVNELLEEKGPQMALNELFTLWSKNSFKPLVVLLDEIDILDGNILISVLSQLRAGYDKRPDFFPQSIVLCGVEDIRYKKITSPMGKQMTGGTLFNIEARSLRLRNFDKGEVEALLHKFTEEQNKEISQEAIDQIWDLTEGQPWVVNALAYEICFEMIPRKHLITRIELREVAEAAENLIQRRESHLKNLADKLQNPRIKRIMASLIVGEEFPQQVTEEDLRTVYDLGLVKMNNGQISVANGIYKEVIPRALIYPTQIMIRYNLSSFMEDDRSLNFKKLLLSFQKLYNKHFKNWHAHFDYKKASQFLFLQAYLQRIIDGGGSIIREYSLGRRYFSMIIYWPCEDKVQKVILDLWILYSDFDLLVKSCKTKMLEAMKNNGVKQGHIIFFPQDIDQISDEKFTSSRIQREYTISVWRL